MKDAREIAEDVLRELRLLRALDIDWKDEVEVEEVTAAITDIIETALADGTAGDLFEPPDGGSPG